MSDLDWPPEDPSPEPGETTPDTVSLTGVVQPFPLREGDLFGPASTAPQVHSGDTEEDMAWIAVIQEQIGEEITGLFDNETASAVRGWRVAHGLEDEDYVDQYVWEQMLRLEKDEDVAVGDQVSPAILD